MEATPKGGTIDLHIRAARAGKNSKAEGVRVAIADTGVGISKANISRIFEPFFTTKGQQGTGLGLWMTQGVVNRLGGVIRVRSSVRPEKSGSCFSIYLPSELLPGILIEAVSPSANSALMNGDTYGSKVRFWASGTGSY